MTMIRLIVLVVLSTIISACGAIGYFIDDDLAETGEETFTFEDAPPDLYYVRGDTINLIDRGSYCWTGASTAMCVDMIPPSYEEDQHILLNTDRIELLFFPPVPDSVQISLRAGSDLTSGAEWLAEAELMTDGSLILTLPDDDLQGRYILFISAIWEKNGDAFYTLPILLGQ
jgi:hypothetical protein